jgi:hypothetical protein
MNALWFLKQNLNLSTRYTIYPASENVIGNYINGTWTGAIGELVRQVRVVNLIILQTLCD